VTDHLIISNDKDFNLENRKDISIHDNYDIVDPLEWYVNNILPPVISTADNLLVFCSALSSSHLFSRKLMPGYTSRTGLNSTQIKRKFYPMGFP
jgi:hypothetical protein